MGRRTRRLEVGPPQDSQLLALFPSCAHGEVGTVRVLVVAATEVEARYLPRSLPVIVSGPGKTAAATATAYALAREEDPPSVLVLNVGTAGALRPDLSGVLLPTRVLNHDISAEALRALEVEPVDVLDVDGRDDIVLATGDSFIESESRRVVLAARADLVDMEGFAVAYAASRVGAAVRLVKHVSDFAGDEARADWRDAIDGSARALGNWVKANV